MTYTIIRFINALFNLIQLAIVLECILSWVPQMRNSQMMNIISSFTYPILEPFRRLQNRFSQGMPIDLSPVLALLVIDIIRKFIVGIII